MIAPAQAWIFQISCSSPTYVPRNECLHALTPELTPFRQISAAYETFFAYSVGDASSVLMGKDIPAQSDDIHHHDPFINNFAPIIIPELQNQAVISVVLGDYHYGALTATGKLFTWGQFSKGALGLGDPMDIEPGLPGGFLTEGQRVRAVAPRFGLIGTPPDVRVPTEVRFDHGSKRERLRYCFAAAASGWHTGALVIDLDVCISRPLSELAPGLLICDYLRGRIRMRTKTSSRTRLTLDHST